MRILLVNPPRYGKTLYSLRDEICFQDVSYVPFPIRLAQLGAILQENAAWSVGALDANAARWGWDDLARRMPEADVVIFQSAAGLIKHDAQVAAIAKRKTNARTILIENVVAPIYSQRILHDFPDIDFVICGFPETIVPDLLRNQDHPAGVSGVAFRGQAASAQPERPGDINKLDDLPLMAYDLFDPRKYSIGYLDAPLHERIVPGIRLRTSRDCPFGCPFCLVGAGRGRGYTGKWKSMSPARVLHELEHVVQTYDVHGFFFWDETFTLDRKRAAEICDRIIKRKLDIEWRCLTRIDCVDEPLLRTMARAGCKLIEYGIEAGDPEVRVRLKKRFSDDDAVRIVRATRTAGIRANCDMIVGMPWETHDTLSRTLRLAKRLSADNVHLTMAFPLPRTEFHDIAEAEGLLQTDDIYTKMVHERVRVGAKPYVRTRALAARDLETAWREIRKQINRYYFVKNVLLRPWDMRNVLAGVRSPKELLRLVPKAPKFVLKHLFGTRG
ncbi:MAG: radical SAM protein [Planctomycetes bacterium]|nr:radical SAM protein [Planctomycetota bacterium]